MPQYNGEHEAELRPFVDAMRHKLASNKHRGQRKWEEVPLETLLTKLRGEVQELEEAIAGGNTVEILLEAADVGNYAMFVATVAIALAAGGQGSSGEQQLITSLPKNVVKKVRRRDPLKLRKVKL